jgi:hypothetical protein
MVRVVEVFVNKSVGGSVDRSVCFAYARNSVKLAMVDIALARLGPKARVAIGHCLTRDLQVYRQKTDEPVLH